MFLFLFFLFLIALIYYKYIFFFEIIECSEDRYCLHFGLHVCKCSMETKKTLAIDVLLLNNEAEKMLFHGYYRNKVGSYKINQETDLLVLVTLTCKRKIVDLVFPQKIGTFH